MGFIIKYNRFIQLIFQQDDMVMENIEVFPTKDCEKLLKKYNLVFRRTSNGLCMYYGDIPYNPIDKMLCLRFGFRLPSRDPVKGINDGVHSALYFSNFSENILKKEEDAMMKERGRVTEKDLCNIKCQSFNRTYSTTDIPQSQSRTWRFTYGLDSSVNKDIVIDMPDDKDFLSITVNPPKTTNYFSDPGLYSMKDILSFESERIYLDSELGKIKTDGVIELFWEDEQTTVPAEIGIQYKINFKT